MIERVRVDSGPIRKSSTPLHDMTRLIAPIICNRLTLRVGLVAPSQLLNMDALMQALPTSLAAHPPGNLK